MKILLFYFAELGSVGGVEIVVRELASSFSRRGHPAGIVELTHRPKARQETPDGTPVWGVTAPSYPKVSHPRSWASFARSVSQFRKIAREFQPDIVHVHYPAGQSLPVVGALALPHEWRCVVTLHGSDIRVSPIQDPEIRPWQARLFAKADAVTAVSAALLEDASQTYPVIRAKGRVVPNGVLPRWFAVPSDHRAVDTRFALFVGRLHSVKGVDTLLKAWPQVNQGFPDAELWLVGDGPELSALQKQAASLGIESRVRFCGQLDQSQLPILYRNAAAVVLPSRHEGMPLILLEAGAIGGIRIASNLPGIPEVIIEGENGFLARPESSEDLARAILGAIGMPEDAAKRMRVAAQTYIRERFSEEIVVANYLALFESLLAKESIALTTTDQT
jgi:glycosyltransferase involved in cell wall biosynthesis